MRASVPPFTKGDTTADDRDAKLRTAKHYLYHASLILAGLIDESPTERAQAKRRYDEATRDALQHAPKGDHTEAELRAAGVYHVTLQPGELGN